MGSGDDTLTVRMPTRAPFDGPGLMRFFADHAVPGLETSAILGESLSFERAVRLPHGRATVRITLDGDHGILCTTRLDEPDDLPTLLARVNRMFDLDADSTAIDAQLARDRTLAPLVARTPGIRIPGSLDAEETLFRTLIGQQISVSAARTVLGRITAELGDGGLFPTAARLVERGREVLRGPASRVASIVGVAEALAAGDLLLDADVPVAEFLARLTALPGIGPWTAGYVAMRTLGTPDVLLTSDLVIVQSAAALGLPGTPRELALHGARWAPWRSYAGMHLWRARPAKVRLVRESRAQPL